MGSAHVWECVSKTPTYISPLHGKRGKDSLTVLSVVLLQNLRNYYKEYKPKVYLFEGARGGQYNTSSVRNILKPASKNTGMGQRVPPHTHTHTLRHSFATHLMEDNINLRYIQTLPGHDSVKTTEIYTRVATHAISQIKNPLDSL